TSITRAQIRELIATKRNESLTAATIRNIIAPVRSIFNLAIEDGLIDRNPAAKIGKHNKESKDIIKKKVDPLTREEVQLFLATVREKRREHYPIFLTAVRTGMRQGELLALKAGDIDFNSKLIHVQRNLSRGSISTTKNGKDRRVDMSEQLS